MDNYWSSVLRSRLSRRRAIAMTGATVAGAAFLAACGGGSSSSGSSSSSSGSPAASGGSPAAKDSSGLLFTVVDEAKNVVRGGTYVDQHPLVLNTVDPMKTGGHIRVIYRGYNQLFRVPDGHLTLTSTGGEQGDLAQSWELSPDKLTITAKLDPGAGLPPIPPVNSRVVDSDDVLFSWQRLQAQGAGRSDLVNSINPASPIVSITAPDKQTVVIKLSEPNATIFTALGTDVLGSMYIIPKEGASAFDPDKTAIGSGPYYMTMNSDVRLHWKRNPNFKRAGLKDNEPYIDEIDEPVIPDYSAALAQFRAGALYEFGVQPQDVLQTKKDLSQLLMRATAPTTFSERLFFGQNQDSIFRDERVRIALMKTLDRDAFIQAAHNTDRFAQAGLPVSTFWEGSLSAGAWSGWYLNPKDSAFGPNAKNYQVDLAAAKQMLEAAGLKTPVEFTFTYAQQAPTSFPATYYTRAEIYLGMIENSGVFKMNRKTISYASEWNSPSYRTSGGKFTGMTWGADTAPKDPAAACFFCYNSKGGYFMGGDDMLDTMSTNIRHEFDDNKRKALVQDLQRYEASKMFNEKVGVAGGFGLTWPVMRNVLVNTGGTNWMDVTTPSGLKAFLDPTQAPLKKS